MGNVKPAIDGQNSVQIFYVYGTSLHLRNLILRNGKISELRRAEEVDHCTYGCNSGGAVSIVGSATFYDVDFLYNNAKGMATPYGEDKVGGGAVALYGGEAIFQRCKFSGNKANPNYQGGGGGAILVTYLSEVYIFNSTFEGNDADEGGENTRGGAILVQDSQTVLEIERCTFRNNSAYYEYNLDGVGGGGVCFL